MPTHAHRRARQCSPGDPVQVLHLPCDLPYTRKLSSPVIHVINGTRLADESEVPLKVTFDWLCAREDLTFFDVLHIHFFEGTPAETLHRVLDKCLTCGRRIIFTVHETAPMFPRNGPAYQAGLKTICTAAHRIITLTRGSAAALLTLVPFIERRLVVIPHGFVLHPDAPAWGRAGSGGQRVEYALYGAFRPNRDAYTLLLNWYFGLLHHRAHLNILSRAIAPRDLHDPALHLPEIMDFL
ncbi:MAG TPA: glycosyltransferase, partial [Gammaproteobacteria bacterium]|nr:glycosyltransferase [Gammaproteobacteria bacterium]